MENKNVVTMTDGSAALNSKESRRIEFERVFRDATEVMVEGIGKSRKVITAVAWIPLDILYVDSRYQGLRTHKQLNRLRKKFNKSKLSNIVVVPHYEENRFAIVDGQGRWMLAEEMGFGERGLPATILLQMIQKKDWSLKQISLSIRTQKLSQLSQLRNMMPMLLIKINLQ